MTFFEDQEDAWYANDCKGRIEDYDGSELDVLELQPPRAARRQRYRDQPRIPVTGQGIEVWFDGACEPVNPGGHGSWGAVVRVNGVSVWQDGGYCGSGSKISNNVAEYQGLIAAVTKAIDFDGDIVVRGDSKLVIMQMQGKWKARGGLYLPFYEEAKALVNEHRKRLKFQWVPRDENAVCDELSKKVLKDRGVKFRIQPE